MSVFLAEAGHVCHFHSLLWLWLLLFGENSLESMLTPIIFSAITPRTVITIVEIEICLSDSNESGSV